MLWFNVNMRSAKVYPLYGFVLSALVFVVALIWALTPAQGEGRSIAQSVVLLRDKEFKPGSFGSGGTGFIVHGNTKPYTATNWHVCRGADGVMYANQNTSYTDAKIKILYEDSEHDLCLLEAAPGEPLRVGPEPSLYSTLFVMGHPMLEPLAPVYGAYRGQIKDAIPMPLPRKGVCNPGTVPILTPRGWGCDTSFVLGSTTLTIFPGNSGSPAVDDRGRVVGIMQSVEEGTGWGNFIPAEYLKAVLEKMP